MHTKIIEKVLVVLFFTLVGSISVFAQKDSTDSVSLSANVDLVSKYIWRGQDLGHTFCIQPRFLPKGTYYAPKAAFVNVKHLKSG